jgi:hypothetical protein
MCANKYTFWAANNATFCSTIFIAILSTYYSTIWTTYIKSDHSFGSTHNQSYMSALIATQHITNRSTISATIGYSFLAAYLSADD